MSRVKRLKERRRKRKNKIKTTSCCLTLALAMGISQGIGTYALFTDTEDVPSDIALSTGDVDVEVNDGEQLENVKPGDKIEIPFTITNKGTLKQNVTVSLDISDSIKNYLINPNVKFNNENISSKYYDLDMLYDLVEEPLSNDNNIEILTNREKEVLDMVVSGLTNKEIARNLYLSENTIKKHITNILDKLDMRNRKDLIIYVKENNIKIKDVI